MQNPEDASSHTNAFDYVLLCVKALPDVYSLADIIQSVVTPQHTCILINTTNTLGVEKHLEDRFPGNVILSLVSGAEITQLGASEFEHTGSTEIWVGPATQNPAIPQAIQNDMSEALAMTLTTGQVDCKVSTNIQQQQYERMIGCVILRMILRRSLLTKRSPIAFHPVSVLFETPNHAELLEKPGVRDMISDIIDELIDIASSYKCTFISDFRQKTMRSMLEPTAEPSTMYQDFNARRPMEVETYLGSPVTLAKAANINAPRIETLYTIMRHANAVNQSRSPAPSSANPPPHSRAPSTVPPNGAPHRLMNGNGRGMLMRGGPMMPQLRRGPPPVGANGYRGPPNGFPSRGPPQMARQPSFDENNLDEFSHVVLYDDIPEGDVAAMTEGGPAGGATLRERELALREKELALREQQIEMQRRGGRRPSAAKPRDYYDEDEDDDDYFDPTMMRGPPPPIDPDNFDMMSVTSRRNKRSTSQGQLRRDVFAGGNGMRGGPPHGRPQMSRQSRASAQILSDMPTIGSNILDNPMIGFASNRYGNVDPKQMHDESRTNSLTAGRLQEMGPAGSPYPAPPVRRTSRSPGNPFGPSGRDMGRPSPPHDIYSPGALRNGGPYPINGNLPAPTPRYPPGQGSNVRPQHVEQQAVVSKPFPPPKGPKSVTGSASASAGSGDSGSANIDSEPSAHSSTSSFAPRPMFSSMAH